MAHAAGFFAPVIGPLILYIVKKDESEYLKYHAFQAMVFQAIVWAVGGATCGIGLLGLALGIWAALEAYKGEWTSPYPVLKEYGR